MKKYGAAIGWIGTILILGAYVLVSFSILSATGLIYQLMNLFGALGIVVDTYFKKDKPPEALNIVWLVIALFAIIKILLIH
jgi:hypothetical protein